MRDKSFEMRGLQLGKAQIEKSEAIGTVKGYHDRLRLAYEKIPARTERKASDQECLDLALFAINCTVGTEIMCPTLLVFGAVSRSARLTPAPPQLERAHLIAQALKELKKTQAR